MKVEEIAKRAHQAASNFQGVLRELHLKPGTHRTTIVTITVEIPEKTELPYD